MPNLRAAALIATALAGAACASHRVDPLAARRAALAALAHADARLLEGCYACLIDARDEYGRLIESPAADIAATRRVGAEALIALREKELSIDATASMGRLQTAASHPLAGADALRLAHLVDLIPPNPAGMSEVDFSAFMRQRMANASPLDAEIDWLATSPFQPAVRLYISVSVQCSPLARPLLAESRRWRETAPAADDPPIVAYRLALCSGPGRAAMLEGIRSSTPTLVEAAYAEARATPIPRGSASSTKARTLTAEAFAGFPQSPAITYLMATITQSAGDCREAFQFYTSTIEMAPRHENAQLGRTICLTYLGRTQEAIEAATTLISWNSTTLRDAYYWRAYNRHRLAQIDLARQDVDESKRRGVSVDNLTLAGIIEYLQDDFPPAISDLNRAWTLGAGGNCVAAWYLGLVHAKQDAWPDAARSFERSLGCYNTALKQDRLELASMQARTDLAPEFQQTQIEALAKVVHDDERYRWDSALNTATSYARAGDGVKAETFLTIADEDPSLAAEVTTLRAALAAVAAAPPAPRTR